jgi:hypothetical protein
MGRDLGLQIGRKIILLDQAGFAKHAATTLEQKNSCWNQAQFNTRIGLKLQSSPTFHPSPRKAQPI